MTDIQTRFDEMRRGISAMDDKDPAGRDVQAALIAATHILESVTTSLVRIADSLEAIEANMPKEKKRPVAWPDAKDLPF